MPRLRGAVYRSVGCGRMISQEAVDLFIDVLKSRRRQLSATKDTRRKAEKLHEISIIATQLGKRLEADYTGYRADIIYDRIVG